MRKLKQRLFSLLLCAALLFSLCAPAAAVERTGDFTVTGGTLDTDYSYADNTLTILKGTTLTISGNTATDKIVVEDGVAANVTLQNVSIDVSGTSEACAFEVAGSASCTLTLAGTNTLKSGISKAGLQVQTTASLTTTAASNGSLNATGGEYAAGIGGGMYGGSGGEITISGGTVTASGIGGAGIGGGGDGGSGGEITISGGTVTASGDIGAGIGGGGSETVGGAGGTITITGGTVTATSTEIGAGIGGGGVYAGGRGHSGTFITGITGPNGSAFIVASSIQDQSGESSAWSGVIFGAGRKGKVYGSPVTLATDAEIPAKRTLEIGEGQILAIGEGVTLTNNGKITGSGTIKGKVINNGTIEDGITVQDHAHQWDMAWSSDATNHWHKCTVTDCNERSETAAHTPGDWVIDKAATSTEAGQRHRECTACGYTMQTETIPATGGGSSGGGSSTPTYKPDVTPPSEGGGVPSIVPSNPKQGDTVTVTPKPDDGYKVDKITVTDRNGKPVEVTVKPDGTYTFQQPSGTVTIDVTYVPLSDLPGDIWNNPFADIDEGDWYYEAVRFVQERGLMNGYSDGRFGPNDDLSRAQLAQILFNKEGGPVVNYLLDFSDVSGEAWYTEAIRWAASEGIVGGYGDGTFGPNDPITREQLAVMLWRYSGSPAATDQELHFNDEDAISGFALEAMRWAVENGIVGGYGNGQLAPQGQATRAQVAQMLKNFIQDQESNP